MNHESIDPKEFARVKYRQRTASDDYTRRRLIEVQHAINIGEIVCPSYRQKQTIATAYITNSRQNRNKTAKQNLSDAVASVQDAQNILENNQNLSEVIQEKKSSYKL